MLILRVSYNAIHRTVAEPVLDVVLDPRQGRLSLRFEAEETGPVVDGDGLWYQWLAWHRTRAGVSL